MSNSSTESGLHKGRLGVVGIVFFVVAAAAPLVGMTGAVPVAMLLGNQAGTPGTYLLVGLTLLVFSVGYAAMSQKVTNTGAFFAYVGKGLGKHAGVSSSFAMLVGYITIQLAIYGFIGGVMSGQIAAQTNGALNLTWWQWALICWVLVTGLSLLSVDVGAKVLGVLMIAELSTLVITSVAVIINHGSSFNLGNSFSLTQSSLVASLVERVSQSHSHLHRSLVSKQRLSTVKSRKTLSALFLVQLTGLSESSQAYSH